MPNPERDMWAFVNRIRLFWILSALLVALIIISSEFLVSSTLSSHEQDTEVLIDLRFQLFATQRLALLAQRIATIQQQAERTDLLEEMVALIAEVQVHLAAISNQEKTLPPQTITAINRGIQEYLDQALIFATTATHSLYEPSLLAIQRQSPQLLEQYNAAISLGQQHRLEKLTSLRTLNLIRMTLALGVLLLQTLIVVLPLLRGMRAKANELVREIEQRERAEVALQEQKRFAENVTGAIPDMVCVFDLSRRQIVYSNAHLTMPEGVTIFSEESVHPEARPQHVQLLAQLANLQDGEILSSELRYQSGADGYRRILSRFTPFLRSPDGSLQQVMAVSQDVTTLRFAEERQKQLELERDRAKLLQEFINNSSHDIRTPLANIQSQASLIARTSDEEARKQRLEIIKSQVQRITALLEQQQQIVGLDRIVSLQSDRMPLVTVLQQAVGVQRMRAAEKEIVLVEEYTARPVLPIHPGYIITAVSSILDNALRVAPQGSTVHIRTLMAADQAVIEIEDQGSGIPEESLPHVFERFYKGNEARTSDGSGAGLGLSVTQRIAELHGGRAEIHRTGLTGTIVRVYLPVSVAG